MQIERIETLIEKLLNISSQLDSLEKALIEKLDNNDEDAHALLDKAINVAISEYHSIGLELNDIGGFKLMQLCYYKVPEEYDCGTVISCAWNGIGDWMD